MLTAWLLLLLHGREMYGYKLRGELGAEGLSADPGGMYRRLRKIEQYGWVRSRWMGPAQGPQRRLYRLTAKGRRKLDEVARSITALHDANHAFLLVYEAQRRRPETIRRATVAVPASSSGSEPQRPGKDLLTAWLLLLLKGGESHGYELGRQLAAAHLRFQPSVLYRVLRTLEQCGCVTSRWGSPSAGPRPRVYELTGAGRRNLDELAGSIRSARDSMDAFLQAHDRARRRRP